MLSVCAHDTWQMVRKGGERCRRATVRQRGHVGACYTPAACGTGTTWATPTRLATLAASSVMPPTTIRRVRAITSHASVAATLTAVPTAPHPTLRYVTTVRMSRRNSCALRMLPGMASSNTSAGSTGAAISSSPPAGRFRDSLRPCRHRRRHGWRVCARSRWWWGGASCLCHSPQRAACTLLSVSPGPQLAFCACTQHQRTRS